MKNKIGLFIFLAIILLFNSCKKETNSSTKFWTPSKAEEHYKNQNDSLKWDYKMFLEDLQSVNEKSQNPITDGVFPVANYKLLGANSFKGLGSASNVKKINHKNISYSSFFIKKNDLNNKVLGSKKSDVFFNILVLTDTLDLKNHKLSSSEINSRNHPNYIGQGMYKTKNNQIDYLAFKTADNSSFTIINMRLFDLKFGSTILIAPQKDKSLRSLQVKMPVMEYEELDTKIDSLINTQQVIDFFSKKSNI